MAIHLDPKALQPLLESIRRALPLVARDNHAAHIKPNGAERIRQPQNIRIIGDAEIAADLVFLNIRRIDDENDLRLILELKQHLNFAIRRKARQNSGSMVIVKKLAAKLQIELAAKLRDPFADLFGLQMQVFFVVKSNALHISPSFIQFE